LSIIETQSSYLRGIHWPVFIYTAAKTQPLHLNILKILNAITTKDGVFTVLLFDGGTQYVGVIVF